MGCNARKNPYAWYCANRRYNLAGPSIERDETGVLGSHDTDSGLGRDETGVQVVMLLFIVTVQSRRAVLL
jgi:hypothetical protein